MTKIKNFIFVLALVIIGSNSLFAQAPDQFDFQSLVRDAEGRFLVNKEVTIRVSIYKGTDMTNDVYQETGTVKTNSNGLLTWTIGKGSQDFSKIDWGKGPYYLKTEVDPNGGSDFTMETTTQLMSVPYALYANKTDYAETARYATKAGDYDNQIQGLRDTAQKLMQSVPLYHPEGFSISPTRQVKFYKSNLSAHDEKGSSPYTPKSNQWVQGFPIFPSKGMSALLSEYAMTPNDYGVRAAGTEGNIDFGWWTLSATQWCYLLFYRKDADKLWGKGQVNNTKGLILLPDGWEEMGTDDIKFVPQKTDYATDANTYSTTVLWTIMQELGAVFLPISSDCNYYATSSIGPSAEGNGKIAVGRLCIGAENKKPGISTDSDILGSEAEKKAYVRLVHDF